MLKILQARLQEYLNHELPDVQAGFRKGRGTREQVANIFWIIKKRREFQKSIYICFIDYNKDFDCVDHNKLWKILKEMGIPDHLTCLLRKLYAGQEATVRTVAGLPWDWGKQSLHCWKETHKILCAPGPREKKQTPLQTESSLSASIIEESLAEVRDVCGSPQG